MTIAKTIMIQGTASSSGKSLITAALCRIFHQDGHKVAPFKAQNMSNNSFVTREGLEMGRAQVVQALAAGLEPDVRMNPVLLKPSSDTGAQVILRGKSAFTMNAKEWHANRDMLRCTIRESYKQLAADYEVIVIEGAGSPAEINLKKNDIVNMGMAKMADAPVVIVGDIDRGGVFASLVGTMQLLDEDERVRVKGFIINKFRGDVGLLKTGLDELQTITGIPVLGVVPWIEHYIDDEDGVTERFSRKSPKECDVDICIIRLPHISNFTDFLPLETIPGVIVRWCTSVDTLGTPDLLILPGTKATIADLQTIQNAGIADAIFAYAKNGGTVMGICGGFQMLGRVILDPYGTESSFPQENGLGLLDMVTTFHAEKKTVQTIASIKSGKSWLLTRLNNVEISGYEIHMGESTYGCEALPFVESSSENGASRVIGISAPSGRVLGTYLHGFFDSARVATGMINAIRAKKGLLEAVSVIVDRSAVMENELNRLAQIVRTSLDMEKIYGIACGIQS